MIPPTHQANKITRWIARHEVVLHDQGEGYQQPKTFRGGNSSVSQGVKEVSKLGPRDLIFLLEIGPIT